MQIRGGNKHGPDYFPRKMGRPVLGMFGVQGDPVVIIPCYHPRHLSDMDVVVTPFAARVFLLVHQIAWFASGVAMRCVESGSSRGVVCREIYTRIEEVLDQGHAFGKVFDEAVRQLCSGIDFSERFEMSIDDEYRR